MDETTLYFAYGSNINLDQMAYRCPEAEAVGPVTLDDYVLLFRGSRAGNGVATIAPQEGEQVQGLLWRITPECERALDRYEGYPSLYTKETVTVSDRQGNSFQVMAYIMSERYREPAVPSSHYYDGIRDGLRQNGMPTAPLRQAWERVNREVHTRTAHMNRLYAEHTKKRRHDRER
ncbi:MAG: gamma-glutamylcyclotransferase [Oscillospiraceae bacterium]|nr:gamma-glutamylcyclotransferase [Oscillospiraceae bacterium]